jgi:hypothetical protein
VSICRLHAAGAPGAGPRWMRQHSMEWGVGPGAARHIDSCPAGQIWKACSRGRSALRGGSHDTFRGSRYGGPNRRPRVLASTPGRPLLGAPISFGAGRHAPDQVRDVAAEPAGWTSCELPGQVTDQLAA